MRPHLLILVASIGLGSGLVAQGSESRDERVQVVLKNGHTMVGVAKSGLRCERQVHGRFTSCNDNDDRAAGIRLWYYQNLDGYIFLDRKSLDHVDVLGLLTPDESRELAAAMSAANGGNTPAAASRPSSRPTSTSDRPAAVDGASYTDDERALLTQFPPEKGWGPEKFGELQRRKIVMHVNPSVEEQAFVDAFPRFQVAWKKWAEEQGRKSEAASGGGDAHPVVKVADAQTPKPSDTSDDKPADDDATSVEKPAKRSTSKSKH